jgi:hypothetical protein
MKIKHSKYKNTGILFELLVRQITSDTLKGIDSPSVNILKKYFVKSELGKEYKLYETLLKTSPLSESRATILVDTIIEASQKLNRTRLRKEKYNLVKEIKDHYNLETFFTSKVKNYKELASVYTLIESYNSQENIDPTQIVDNKVTLLEHLTKQEIKEEKVKEDILKEYESYDKDLKILTYKVLLEKFNSKYQDLSTQQKQVLKEFINSVDSTSGLRDFYNAKVNELKLDLVKESKNVKDKATQIKIVEVSKLLQELGKTCKVTNDHMVDLLQYYELIQEIQKSNESI